MKRTLLGTFYTLQGIGNLTFGLLALISDYIFGFLIAAPLALASCLSILTALLLFLGLKYWACNYLAWYSGIASSSLFILFYVFLITGSSSNIQMGYYVYHYSILLMVSLIIVVLNVVSMIGLYSFAESKRIRD
jgi:hypothetical protein